MEYFKMALHQCIENTNEEAPLRYILKKISIKINDEVYYFNMQLNKFTFADKVLEFIPSNVQINWDL